jgi:hypothetical protein
MNNIDRMVNKDVYIFLNVGIGWMNQIEALCPLTSPIFEMIKFTTNLLKHCSSSCDSSSHWKLTCSRHDIPETLLRWC